MASLKNDICQPYEYNHQQQQLNSRNSDNSNSCSSNSNSNNISSSSKPQPLTGSGHLHLRSPLGSVKTAQLLNQLCNESQDDESVNRDACYGCFFRASSHQSRYPLLLSMADCADNYLNNTEYRHCAQYLKNATSSVSAGSNPSLIYCSFLECVRQVNKDQLSALVQAPRDRRNGKRCAPVVVNYNNFRNNSNIFARNTWSGYLKRTVCIIKEINFESYTARPGAEPVDPRILKYYRIRECVSEAAQLMSMSNPDGTSIQLPELFVNTTACILAKTRCENPNPINGAISDDYWKDKNLLNALFVNSDYDITILRLPFGGFVPDECHKYRNLEVASWPTTKC
ncbi:uncharacterized protein LOC131669260 [Phymastichus coffea]|uniref:uncharacterized protein LOC131669260 n=1 Tax=Phymastichus coffea TaxID=108790 RepID=UPI00273B6BEC|nr:uncharacterized protein LOC131669260 [Phymastichus coffea]